MKIRIKDIAERANVSVGTVDRVLHNRGEVAAATRQRVMEIARALDYQPDILARALASRKRFHIATLTPAGNTPDSMFWLGPLTGIRRAIESVGPFNLKISCFQFDLHTKGALAQKAAELLASSPDGVVLAPVYEQEAQPLLASLQERRIPYALINSDLPHGAQRLCYIGQDAYQSGVLAAKLMHQGLEGSPRILVLNMAREYAEQQHIQLREKGFRDYFAPYPGVQIHTASIHGAGQIMVDHELARHLIPNHGMVGLFVTSSKVHKAALFLESNRIKRIRLIGYDLIEPNRRYLERGTIEFIIDQRPEEQGYRGIMAVFQHLVLRKSVEPYQHMPLDIITRENLGYHR